MNFKKFLESLSLPEIKELKLCISEMDNPQEANTSRIAITEFIRAHQGTMSSRLYNVLRRCSEDSVGRYNFNYITDLNKIQFVKIRNAGETTWNELCEICLEKYQLRLF